MSSLETAASLLVSQQEEEERGGARRREGREGGGGGGSLWNEEESNGGSLREVFFLLCFYSISVLAVFFSFSFCPVSVALEILVKQILSSCLINERERTCFFLFSLETSSEEDHLDAFSPISRSLFISSMRRKKEETRDRRQPLSFSLFVWLSSSFLDATMTGRRQSSAHLRLKAWSLRGLDRRRYGWRSYLWRGGEVDSRSLSTFGYISLLRASGWGKGERDTRRGACFQGSFPSLLIRCAWTLYMVLRDCQTLRMYPRPHQPPIHTQAHVRT